MPKIAWAPQEGDQVTAMSCPVPEICFHGDRGGGKSILAVMRFAKYVGRGWGSKWRGILFRESYKELNDIELKTREWFSQIWTPKEAWYNSTEHYWQWKTGETFLLRHFDRDSDYYDYHGHEYAVVIWEELTNRATPVAYRRMKSTWRTPHKEIEPYKLYLSTCNPAGPGHHWVKAHFKITGYGLNWRVIDDAVDEQNDLEVPRVALPVRYEQNSILKEADPNYRRNIAASASNDAEREAWLSGNWDVVAGGMFSDVWQEKYNVIDPFIVPDDWELAMAHDWGSATPFANQYAFESTGTDFLRPGLSRGGFKRYSSVRGDLYNTREWYGSRPGNTFNIGLRLSPSEVAKGTIEREIEWGWGIHERVSRRWADKSIFSDARGEDSSIANELAEAVRLDSGLMVDGLDFEPAARGPLVRENGWELLRGRLKGAWPNENKGPREKRGLFFTTDCPEIIRVLPALPRKPTNLRDIPTDIEDHGPDAERYLVFEMDGGIAHIGDTKGL